MLFDGIEKHGTTILHVVDKQEMKSRLIITEHRENKVCHPNNYFSFSNCIEHLFPLRPFFAMSRTTKVTSVAMGPSLRRVAVVSMLVHAFTIASWILLLPLSVEANLLIDYDTESNTNFELEYDIDTDDIDSDNDSVSDLQQFDQLKWELDFIEDCKW
jgi:hypothetical protein